MSKPTLTQNLQTIYTVKNQIKEVIGTDSDLFEEYPSLIEDAIEAGGGSGESGDPFYDAVGFSPEMVEEVVPYVSTIIGDNFQVNEKGGNIDSIEYEYTQDDGKGGTWNIHVLLDSDPNNLFANSGDLDFTTYPDLYGNVFPIVANAVVTVSENPNYDYLIAGELYTWNLMDNAGEVETITENGFIVNNGALGYDVQISGGGSGTFDYDSCYSGVTIFNEISYGMFDLYNYTSNNPYDNSWMMKTIDPVIEGTSYIYQTIDFRTLGNIDLTTQFSGMSPDNTGYTENSQWKIYDDSNYEQNVFTAASLFDFSTGEQWAHIQYQNNSGADQFIKFARVPMTWDSMGSQWYPDTSNETEINSMPVVTYDEYGASSAHNGTYMFLNDGESIDLYLRFYYGDMGDPDSCEVYSGIGDPMNSQPMKWYNIEGTNLGKFNFVEYDENNWPPQA